MWNGCSTLCLTPFFHFRTAVWSLVHFYALRIIAALLCIAELIGVSRWAQAHTLDACEGLYEDSLLVMKGIKQVSLELWAYIGCIILRACRTTLQQSSARVL